MSPRFRRILRGLIIVVGSVDFVLGCLLLFVPVLLPALLGIPLPDEVFWVRVGGLLQLGLAAAYILGGVDPQRYQGNIILAAVMRLTMAVLLITAGMQRPAFKLFIFIGMLEIPIGLSHAMYAAGLYPRK